MRKLSRRVKHFFFAHKGNKFKPGLFARESVAAIVLALLLLEGAYYVQVHVVLSNRGFLATVLPAALTTLANNDRAAEGLGALVEDLELDAVAQAKAEDMARKGYFAHVSPEGRTPWYWLDTAKYPYTYAGENLAVDFTDSADVERAWMDSPMHRANILKGQYTHVGIGIAQGMYEGKQVTFVAQFFATRAEAATVPEKAVAVASVPAASVPATEPAETVAAAPSRVLGQEVSPAPAAAENTAAVIATSPARTVTIIVSVFSALIALFLILALLTHARRRLFYTEVIAGGLVILGIATCIVLYNGTGSAGIVPQNGQAASVALTL
jgi:hypothetical protein